MSNQFTASCWRNDIHFPVVIEYDYHKGSRASRDKLGAPLEPDAPPEIEILHVWTNDGADFALDCTPLEMVAWIGFAEDHAADAKYEAQMEKYLDQEMLDNNDRAGNDP